jgi:hypothetical protein
MKTSKEIRMQIEKQYKVAEEMKALEQEAAVKGSHEVLIYQQMYFAAKNVAKALEAILEEVVNAEINLNPFDDNKLFTK